MTSDQAKSFQFSIRTLLIATVAVAVWFSGFAYLIQMESNDPYLQIPNIKFQLTTIAVVMMTIASTAVIFIIYGILLLMVLGGDQQRESYYREILKSWRLFVLLGTVAAAPWLLVLARS